MVYNNRPVTTQHMAKRNASRLMSNTAAYDGGNLPSMNAPLDGVVPSLFQPKSQQNLSADSNLPMNLNGANNLLNDPQLFVINHQGQESNVESESSKQRSA